MVNLTVYSASLLDNNRLRIEFHHLASQINLESIPKNFLFNFFLFPRFTRIGPPCHLSVTTAATRVYFTAYGDIYTAPGSFFAVDLALPLTLGARRSEIHSRSTNPRTYPCLPYGTGRSIEANETSQRASDSAGDRTRASGL